MKPSEVAAGKYNHIDVIDYLEGKPKSSIKAYLDEMVGEACLLNVGMTGFPADTEKAKRLFNVVELVSEALMPDYQSRQEEAGYENQDNGGGANRATDFPTKKPPRERLPEELKTEKAMRFWRKAVEVGLVDEDFNPKKGITHYVLAEFTHTFSTKLGLRYRFSYFHKLWGIKGLGQARNKASELGYDTGEEKIHKVFS